MGQGTVKTTPKSDYTSPSINPTPTQVNDETIKVSKEKQKSKSQVDITKQILK